MPQLKPIATPRTIASFDTARLSTFFADTLILGSGVAGLRAAATAAEAGSVIIATKRATRESNTEYAQGGIAAVVGANDTIESHLNDTLRTGRGLCYEPAARKAVEEAPGRIRELRDWGARFDGPAGAPELGMEGGHTAHRILHADGDSTGREIERTLVEKVSGLETVSIFEDCFAVDLLTVEGACRGALVYHEKRGMAVVWAGRTVLATGGCGQAFRETTNPAIATGDGIAIAYRAGAAIENIEFVQFHPTTLYIAGACRFLLSEAMRGEGARLTDKTGRPFMAAYDERADLAPRDVVSRAIIEEMKKTGKAHVYLDLTHLDAAAMRKRFPAIVALVTSFDINIATERIPVHPSAHYLVGGVMTDLHGRTTVPNLYAVGEAASTGMHGANRLASNSLLEGLVFGAAAGDHLAARARQTTGRPMAPLALRDTDRPASVGLDRADLLNSMRALVWRQVGIVRSESSLTSARNALSHWAHYALAPPGHSPADWEVQNVLTVASLMTGAALARTESRGVHYREDFPEPNGEVGEPSVVTADGSRAERGRIDWD